MNRLKMINSKVVFNGMVVIFSGVTLFLTFANFKSSPADFKQLQSLVMDGISQVHYSPKAVDDSLSKNIFNEFLKRLDNNKKFFTQKDIAELTRFKFSIDNELTEGTTAFFDATMKIFSKRIDESYRYSKEHLDVAFNFDRDESIETNEDKFPFANDTLALKDDWRKYMKLQTLQILYEQNDRQVKAKAKADTVKLKSFEQLEKESRDKVKKNNEDFFKRIRELDNTDWFAVYINCISNIEDPHTEYFPPVDKQNFDIQMSGQLEGIGAQLQQRDGEIKIVNIVAGSASWRQGQLKAGDVILKVAQGAAEPVNVEGMRLDKAIQLIRGKKGTEVRLTIRKPDGTVLVVPLIRDIVILESTYAQSALINKEQRKIGYIRLSEFYTGMGKQGGRNCSDDVKIELQKLQAENADGVILDLRDNGGGSLQEAVKLGGLFIPTGPIVQVRSRANNIRGLNDYDPAVTYNGKLIVMVNGYSASASEIIAAALQDYHRALLIGTNTTYGKGTVQNFYDLDELAGHDANSKPELGTMKITIQKYYRINGGTTQLKGVTPDIILPDAYEFISDGEKEDHYAIGSDEIPAASYKSYDVTYNLANLKSKSEKRINSSSSFQLIKEEATDFKTRNDFSVYPLSFEKYSALQKQWDENEKKYEAINSDSTLVNISNLSADSQRINVDSSSVARNQQFIKNLRKDIYLNEAVNVLVEMK